jgi:hypothetical protein
MGAKSTRYRDLECDCKEPGSCAFSWAKEGKEERALFGKRSISV